MKKLTNSNNYCKPFFVFILEPLKPLNIFAGTPGDLVGNVSQFLHSLITCSGNPFQVNYLWPLLNLVA